MFYYLCCQSKAFARHHQGEGKFSVATFSPNTHIALYFGITKLCAGDQEALGPDFARAKG